MKIALISPYPDIYSFGVRSLSAALRQAGHETVVLFLTRDFNQPYPPSVLRDVVELCSDCQLVGLSVMTNFWDNCVQLTTTLRSELGRPIVWGGIHPTIRPAECLQHADYVAVGESEQSIVEWLKGYPELPTVPGVFSRQDCPEHYCLPCLDPQELPFPDYDLSHQFVLDNERVVPLSEELLAERTGGVYVSIPSRGCPFSCSYCCNHFLNQHSEQSARVRQLPLTRVIEELKSVTRQHPCFNQIKFDDDAFFSYPLADLIAFSQAYQQQIALPLIITGVTPHTLTREKLETMVAAGLCEVRMGIESAAPAIRKLYRRPQTESKVLAAARLLNEFQSRLLPWYDFIVDNPWETEQDLVASLRFAWQLPVPHELILYSLTFYPGTALYDRACSEGLISNDLEDVYRKYYHGLAPTYLNNLFIVMSHYAHWGERIPSVWFNLAVNPVVRCLPGRGLINRFLLWRLRKVLQQKNKTPSTHRIG